MIIILETIIEFRKKQVQEQKDLIENIKKQKDVDVNSRAFDSIKNSIEDGIHFFLKDIVLNQKRIEKLNNDNLDFSNVKLVEDLDKI
jgi:hypothetical protein